MNVRKWVIGIALVSSMAVGASAQVPSAPPAAETEQVKARQKIFMMEGVLERAVQLGVDNLRRKVRSVMPDDALLQGGMPQVRGFRLDGYGVFFDVEVPALRQSLAWTLRTMNDNAASLARDLASMRAFVRAIDDPRVRAEFDRTLARIQQQMGPPQVAAVDRVAPAGMATVTAQSVGTPAPAAVPAAPSAAQVDPLVVTDPSQAYTQEVKAALIDAMIENSGPLVLGNNEWLTVAARDNAPGTPFMPADQGAMTIVLRVKGSDLSDFRAGRLTLEQMRTGVQVGEF
jgi:hypothetical protein